jgi:two-component system, NtrC family, response regulator HydG
MTLSPTGRPLRLLVVDDEPAVLMTLAANLELEGHEVIEASDAQRALALADHTEFDVLLTDVRMPGMNGIDLFRAMRKKKPGLRAIVMTAFAVEELVDQGLQEGVYTVLRKPFDPAQLSALARRAARGGVVLVVDDTPHVAQSIAAALESAGIPAIDEHSAAAALARLKSTAVDTCLIDLVMADVAGAELCREIRAEADDIVLLAMTGHHVPQMVADAAKAGSFACLRKPFDLGALVRTVARARREC